jgi:hypothetical protein
MTRSGLLWLPIGALLCACGDVPTLTFQQADASLDAGEGGSDEGGPGSCIAPNDGGLYLCCGTLACQGQGLCANCDACHMKCDSQPGTFCCAKTNNFTCPALGMDCHG